MPQTPIKCARSNLFILLEKNKDGMSFWVVVFLVCGRPFGNELLKKSWFHLWHSTLFILYSWKELYPSPSLRASFWRWGNPGWAWRRWLLKVAQGTKEGASVSPRSPASKRTHFYKNAWLLHVALKWFTGEHDSPWDTPHLYQGDVGTEECKFCYSLQHIHLRPSNFQ